MMKALQTHMRVIGAIAVREINSQQASLMYGYVWALIDLALSIVGLLILRVIIKGFAPPGIPPACYLLSGLVPWAMFSTLYHQPDAAIRKGSALRAFPIVTGLDCVFGASVYAFITYLIVLVGSMTVASIVEQVSFPRFPLGVMLVLLGMSMIGVGLGLVLMLIQRIWAPIMKFIGVVLRFGVFLSGVIISITRFPSFIWPYLTWNPILHAMELLRQYWFPAYVSPIGRPSVIIEWAVGLLALGLVCERYARIRYPAK